MTNNEFIKQIMKFSRQEKIRPLTEFHSAMLETLVRDGHFQHPDYFKYSAEKIIDILRQYGDEHNRKTVVLGMSGGLDSSLCAKLFKEAGYEVIGVTLPIHQNPVETQRGINACNHIGIKHINIDLTNLYEATLKEYEGFDDNINETDDKTVLIRRGNIRARHRMIALYNLASKYNGFVASTDNLSELGAGFWTLHGDVGDVSPIQSLNKSWEVPFMAYSLGLPEDIVFATPTDGLGIDNGDEAQLGCTYLEWDITMLALINGYIIDEYDLDGDNQAIEIFNKVRTRMKNTAFKRVNPLFCEHPQSLNTITKLEEFDKKCNYNPSIYRIKGWMN